MCTDAQFSPSTQLLARLQRITVGPLLFVAFMAQWRFLLLLLLARSTAFPMRQCCRPLISTLAGFALLSWLQLNSWQSSSTAGPKTWAMSRRPSQGHQFVSDFHLFMWHFYLFILCYKCWFEIFLIYSSHFEDVSFKPKVWDPRGVMLIKKHDLVSHIFLWPLLPFLKELWEILQPHGRI